MSHVALAHVACQPSPTAHAKPPSLVACGAAPNFAFATDLKRWSAFPVDVFLDLDSVPRELRESYRKGMVEGLSAWGEATGGTLGAFRVRYDREDAPVRISVTEGSLVGEAVGTTELSFRDIEIVEARVVLARSRYEDSDVLVHDVANTTAHEIGHVLGIVDHSPYEEDKMSRSGNFGPHNQDREPHELITARDVNTLREAYCR